MTNDARSKLRSMGGIMASSPELMQVAQKFQLGGPVAPMAPPTMPRPLMDQTTMGRMLRPTMPSFIASDRPLPATNPPRATRLGSRTFLLTDDNRVIDAETNSPAPAALANEVRRKLGVADVVPEYRESGPLTFGGGASPNPSIPEMPFDRRVPKGIEGGKDEQRFVTREPQSSAQMRENTFPSLLTEEPEDPTIDNLLDISALGGINMGAFNGSLYRDREIPRTSTPTPNESPIPAKETPGPEETLSPEETLMAQPLVPEKIDQDAIDRMQKLVESDPNITPPPPGGDGPPRKETKRDLRSRYNEKIALFKEIYGTDDKDEAQDRAMSLAMIGLAIAAGQSPDALTNIAQGLMVGAQGIGARREAERERERGLKTLALQTAIDQMGAETEAEAEAAKLQFDRDTRLMVEREKNRGGGSSRYEQSPIVAEFLGDERNTIMSAIEENPGIVPDQYKDNQSAWVDLELKKRGKAYIRQSIPQTPEDQRANLLLAGQELLYQYPQDPSLRIVQNSNDLVFIMPGQKFAQLDPKTREYSIKIKRVDPETGNVTVADVE